MSDKELTQCKNDLRLAQQLIFRQKAKLRRLRGAFTLYTAVEEAEDFISTLLNATPKEAIEFLNMNGERVQDILLAAMKNSDEQSTL